MPEYPWLCAQPAKLGYYPETGKPPKLQTRLCPPSALNTYKNPVLVWLTKHVSMCKDLGSVSSTT